MFLKRTSPLVCKLPLCLCLPDSAVWLDFCYAFLARMSLIWVLNASFRRHLILFHAGFGDTDLDYSVKTRSYVFPWLTFSLCNYKNNLWGGTLGLRKYSVPLSLIVLAWTNDFLIPSLSFFSYQWATWCQEDVSFTPSIYLLFTSV